MSKHKQWKGLALILVLSAAAVALAVIQLISAFDSLAIYNLVRALVFAFGCVYFYRNPTKVNVVGPLKIRDSGNASSLNIKTSYFLSYLFSIVNLAISVVLYFDR